ncbi:MAG TPA: Gfo/Idh/MocA family oxidoreductase [Devosiaceae bacterium]|nr:Gfo/Idh/MocA family oxidoreductase [Devosiaceae bacterium]
MSALRVVGINFDHMHMGDLLREVHEHSGAEIVGICDSDSRRMAGAIEALAIPSNRVFTDVEACLAATEPDLVILCPAPAEHARYVEMVAPFDTHILVEKPFAASAADARRMMAAMRPGWKLAINWPSAWSPGHNTAKRLLDEGRIGRLLEVHYYGGNRGPLYHTADKVEVSEEEVERQKPHSWFYKEAHGGGSLIDYLGYGTTLGTWYHGGAEPIEITAMVDETPGIEVDQHSVSVARYAQGLSKFETRWGTISDPWTQQPLPKCGFVLVGTEGAISSYDYEDNVALQRRGGAPEEVPVDVLPRGRRGAIDYMVDRIQRDLPIDGPLAPELSLIGQRMLDTALASAKAKRTLRLLP